MDPLLEKDNRDRMGIHEAIKQKVRSGRYEYSKHAVDQTILRRISVAEVREALLSDVELLEDYPDDVYGPSCPLLGFAANGRPLHIVCSHPTRSLVKIITVYEPDPNEWLDLRKRP